MRWPQGSFATTPDVIRLDLGAGLDTDRAAFPLLVPHY